MPGGVGGVQSIMAAPYPDFLVTDLTLPQSHWADDKSIYDLNR